MHTGKTFAASRIASLLNGGHFGGNRDCKRKSARLCAGRTDFLAKVCDATDTLVGQRVWSHCCRYLWYSRPFTNLKRIQGRREITREKIRETRMKKKM